MTNTAGKGEHPQVRSRLKARSAYALLVLGLLVPVLIPRNTPASVEEQRARLPPPARCSDPVEGVWMAHVYESYRHEWYQFTLTIQRESPTSSRLRGDILSHYWIGGDGDQNPPPCSVSGYERLVRMPAEGEIRADGEVTFGGTSWHMERVVCGPSYGGYNPDHFSGHIDPTIQEFQSVNNDGGAAVNEPTVFRRIRCPGPTAPPLPTITVVPPRFSPRRNFRGCGRP